MMVLETSRYAAQFIEDNVGSLKPHSVVHNMERYGKRRDACPPTITDSYGVAL